MLVPDLLTTRPSLRPEVLTGFFRRHTEVDATKSVMTAAEQLRAEGVAVGKAEGMAVGRAEGKAEALRGVLLKLIRLRFGAPSEEAVAPVVGADDAEVEAWVEGILTAQSLEQLLGG